MTAFSRTGTRVPAAARPLPLTFAVAAFFASPFAAVAEPSGAELSTVEVVGSNRSGGYHAEEAAGAKTDLPVRELPQSVRVVTRQAIDDLGATRLDDVLDYAGGVTRQNDFGGLWDKYAIRGFAGDENAGPDILINRFSSNLGYNAPIDTATIERIEVLKGASAALSGRGEPGGSINIVTKAPLAQLHASATASYGSWDSWRLATDVGGPVDARRGAAVDPPVDPDHQPLQGTGAEDAAPHDAGDR